MEQRETCGYKGHYCMPGSVRFISRYRLVNDYCVGGKRVSVNDNGEVSANATNEDLQAILAFECAKYEAYVKEHNQGQFADLPLQPFDCGIVNTRICVLDYERGI